MPDRDKEKRIVLPVFQTIIKNHLLDEGLASCIVPKLRSLDEMTDVRSTTTMVPIPPLTTEKTGPNQWATVPDSNPPS